MRHRYQYAVGISACALLVSCSALAHAQGEDPTFNWHFSEFFSNANGSVQFVELECNGDLDNEILATGATFHSNSTGSQFSLTGILEAPTLHKKLLLATPGFDSLPGAVTPDFLMPAGFFFPTNDFVTLNHHSHGLVDSQTFLPATPVPTNGLTSRNFLEDNTTFLATNSPTNFAGQTGSVNLSSGQILPGDYNDNDKVDAADYIVWRNSLGPFNTIPNDTTAGSVTDEDYGVWRQNFANPGGSAGQTLSFGAAVPEPGGVMLIFLAMPLVATMRQRRFTFASASLPLLPPRLPRSARGNPYPSDLS
jgi:hypothetical protein